MKLLRLDTSVRINGSVSRTVADHAERRLVEKNPDLTVRRRDLGHAPLPSLWPDALKARTSPNYQGYLAAEAPTEVSEIQREGTALAEEVVDELLDCDAYLLAVPMYNFSVPQQLKHWVDLVIVDPRGADTRVQILKDRPALAVVTKGGAYGPGTPMEGCDSVTPWIQTILGRTWGLDLTIVEVELTMAQHNPAMEHLVPFAKQLRATAEEQVLRWADKTAGKTPSPDSRSTS